MGADVMAATALRTVAAAGCLVRLNETADGLTVGPSAAITADVRAVVAAHRPALVTALVAAHAEATAIAALLRRLRHTRSPEAPAGLSVRLAPEGAARPLVVEPDPRLVPAELLPEFRRLADPLYTDVLTRDLFGDAAVAVRADAMRRQMRAWQAEPDGLPPFLLAGRRGWPRFDHCFSCGTPLAHDYRWDGVQSATEPGYGLLVRCGDCLAARDAVCGALGETEGRCWCGEAVYRYLADGSPVCQLHAEIAWCGRCRERPVAGRWTKPERQGGYRVCGPCGERGAVA